jgi:glyoxylase-like metal-dependent hydrolase (beta-lactamase superfamily II)
LITHTLPVGPPQTSCYLAACKETPACVIIDPGGDADEILAFVYMSAAIIRVSAGEIIYI